MLAVPYSRVLTQVMKYTGWGNTWQNPIEFNAPCGGYVVVHGSNVKPEIQVYYADGKPYSTDLQYTMHMIGAGKVHGNHTANSTVTEQAPSNRTLPPTVIGVPVNETLNSSAIAQVPGNRTLNNPFGQVPTSNNTHNSTVSLHLIDVSTCPTNAYRPRHFNVWRGHSMPQRRFPPYI